MFSGSIYRPLCSIFSFFVVLPKTNAPLQTRIKPSKKYFWVAFGYSSNLDPDRSRLEIKLKEKIVRAYKLNNPKGVSLIY